MAKQINRGQFTSWHMERASGNKYGDNDQTVKPGAGERARTLKTDGRPSGTHYVENPWHDGGSGDRGSRASDLAQYNGSTYEKQSPNDAPFMKGDRSRVSNGALRQVRADQKLGNNPSIVARAPDMIERFGGKLTIGQLRAKFDGKSVKEITNMTAGQRAKELD